jgi:hypothetical protein
MYYVIPCSSCTWYQVHTVHTGMYVHPFDERAGHTPQHLPPKSPPNDLPSCVPNVVVVKRNIIVSSFLGSAPSTPILSYHIKGYALFGCCGGTLIGSIVFYQVAPPASLYDDAGFDPRRASQDCWRLQTWIHSADQASEFPHLFRCRNHTRTSVCCVPTRTTMRIGLVIPLNLCISLCVPL